MAAHIGWLVACVLFAVPSWILVISALFSIKTWSEDDFVGWLFAFAWTVGWTAASAYHIASLRG